MDHDNTSYVIRANLVMLICSILSFEIETGRFTSKEETVCNLCDYQRVENEHYHPFEYSALRETRVQ